MFRIALGVDYDGNAYSGWQRQAEPSLKTIQATLEQALSQIADHPVSLVCAGRTDAGVHAVSQVVHFDTHAERELNAWVRGAGSLLPHDIAVRWARRVNVSFHARFSALSRRYCYLIFNAESRSALLAGRVCHERRALDVERMRQAAQALVGEHDFSSFRGAGCQSRSPWRRVDEILVERAGRRVTIMIRANAFLLRMVRNIVGALLAIGRGDLADNQLAALLAARDRRQSPAAAPAAGLYLAGVAYPLHFELPSDPQASLF